MSQRWAWVARSEVRLARLGPWRADAVAAVAGGIAAFALPPDFQTWCLVLGIAALLLLIGAAPGPLGAARRGLAWGFGFHVVGLAWITNAILLRAAEFWWAVPLATPFLALVLAPFVALPAALARAAPTGLPRLAAFAGWLVLAELVREFIFTGFPWNPIGSVLEYRGRAGDVAIQAASVVGVDGLTLAAVLVAGSVVAGWRALALAAATVVAVASFGVWRLDRPLPPPAGIDLVLVQGNVPEAEKISRDAGLAVFRRYLDLTRQGVASAGGVPSVVAWPEAASPYLIGGDGPALDAIAAASRPARATFVGAIRFGADGRPRNSLFAVEPDATVGAVFDKAHLVPWGEYQPKVVPIQIIPGGGFAAGPGRATLRLPGVPPVSPLICYEDIFSARVLAPGPRPSWLLVVTNDAWFGDSAGPRQHLAAARLRAVEEGLPLARAANTGITAVFDARGHETTRLGLGRTGSVVTPLPGALPPTLFARFGLFVPGVLALVFAAWGMLAEVSSWSKLTS